MSTNDDLLACPDCQWLNFLQDISNGKYQEPDQEIPDQELLSTYLNMEAILPLLIAEECHQNPATECGGVHNWHTPTNTSGYAEPSGSALPSSTQAAICPPPSPAWDALQSNSYVPACPQGYLADASTATSTFWLPRNTVRLDCFLDGSGCCNQMYPAPTRVAYDYANVVDMYAPTSSYASPPAYRDASSLGLGSSTCSDLLALEVYAYLLH